MEIRLTLNADDEAKWGGWHQLLTKEMAQIFNVWCLHYIGMRILTSDTLKLASNNGDMYILYPIWEILILYWIQICKWNANSTVYKDYDS